MLGYFNGRYFYPWLHLLTFSLTLILTFSIRNLEAVLPILEATNDIVFALEYNYLNALDDESKQAVRGFIKSIWNR